VSQHRVHGTQWPEAGPEAPSERLYMRVGLTDLQHAASPRRGRDDDWKEKGTFEPEWVHKYMPGS